jgi:hypothetical protein
MQLSISGVLAKLQSAVQQSMSDVTGIPFAWKLRSDYSFLWMWNKNSSRFRKTSLFSDAILKAKTVNLAALIRSRARQHSRLTWIRNRDACTKLFMLHTSNRRRKLFILSLKVDTGLATTQQHKQEVVFNHFVSLLGRTQTRLVALNWSHLGYEQQDLSNLEDLFEEDEIKKVIMQLPNEKAPGPHGFIGLFYKKYWPIIRMDLLELLEAPRAFHSLRTQRLDLINEANVVLLPKAPDATTITKFRPISLINSLAKIITKVLDDRLAPRLNDLVSTCQNAFIKKRCIHDNFLYVQSVIKGLHKTKRSALFIKLDISKAFDSVSWIFLLETL